jgi:hypothetical protein
VARKSIREPEYWMRAGRGARPALVIVQEEDAGAAVNECFEEITAALGFPVVSVIFRAFAKYPRFLRLQWDFLRPNALTQDFFDKTEVLRRHAQAEVKARLGVGDYRAALRLRGSSDDAITEMRAVLDFFLYCDPFLLLIASALQSGLAKRPLAGKPWAYLLPFHTNPTRFQEVRLVESEQASEAVRQVYREVSEQYCLPFVPTDFRALGRWPDLLLLAWEDWKTKMQAPAYAAAVRELNELSVALALDLPFAFALSRESLREAGFTPPQISDILATVDLFQGLLPALVIGVAALKLGLEGSRGSR